MKNIEVVAAIIINNKKILSTQRGYGSLKGGWEFPGGKIEKNETHIQALKREIKEELNACIEVDNFLITINHSYPDMNITMHCYICHLVDSNIELLEHSDFRWLSKSDLDDVNWLPADIDAVEKLKNMDI
ncbi:(deoxy)nucleoside triphosphate pyrophosphohydrolase [Peptacetobacter hominis]|uniref:8-oxo-dGTP diphosphatase n=1 Tax=Peptacetobacter hominis TaxID=2743610 RepID=A0A544QXC2_9FIRM|nr:(deoxy)nucleoside triphosphate pyrophosphohydrolase [Peptacetobacter hominis]TQQ85343.1 (deoxy)nucleoside triphosphate pyrophosphohydrolase [Peptacetobacter hominis]